LKEQIANNGIGFYSYLVRSALAYPEDRLPVILFGAWWFLWWSVRRLILSSFNPRYFNRELILAELWGSLKGLGRYQKARRTAMNIQRTYGPTTQNVFPPRSGRLRRIERTFAVRAIDLGLPLTPVTGLEGHQQTMLYLTHRQRLLGKCTIANGGESISRARLCDEIARLVGLRLFDLEGKLEEEQLRAAVIGSFSRRIQGGESAREEISMEYLPSTVPVSVVIATRDRPADLRRCLEGIASQDTRRRVEVIVVDNNPESGQTPAVLTEFPDVLLVQERRKGLSYARNRGIAASTGEIIITTDDDVTIPSHWLEALLTPFSQPDVMVVTGNVLPAELSSKAQVLFEEYGGLSRGEEDFERGLEWFVNYRFRAVPTWDLGATANAAFRSEIFADREIGLFHEALGAGSPTGCSEDTYLYYKILKAGCRAIYRADAFVWHHHRRDMASLRRQIYNYSKGHVAYNLLTVFNDHDLRGLVRLMVELPLTYLFRVKEYLRGRSHYPPPMILLEIAGNLAGGPALAGSLLRARILGKSDPYIPVADRSEATTHAGKQRRSPGIDTGEEERILQRGSEFYDIRMEDPVSEN
jgi:GT2 family glycosyltransferase